jgi:hypothetical protein
MKDCVVYRASKMNDGREKCLQILVGDLRGRDHLGGIGIDKGIVLERRVKKECVKLWTALAENGIFRNGKIYKPNSVNRISFYYYLRIYTSNSTNTLFCIKIYRKHITRN